MNQSETQQSRPKRPRTVTILALSVLIIAVFFLARVFQAITLRSFIDNLEASVSPAYLIVTGLIFGTVGLPIAWGLWTGRKWVLNAALQFFVALAAYYWLDYIFVVVSDTVRGNWPFASGTTIIGLSLVFWILKRRSGRIFFNNSRESVPANGDTNVE